MTPDDRTPQEIAAALIEASTCADCHRGICTFPQHETEE